LPGELLNLERVCWSLMATSENTQIYEGMLIATAQQLAQSQW
jgi:hypothetical protein